MVKVLEKDVRCGLSMVGRKDATFLGEIAGGTFEAMGGWNGQQHEEREDRPYSIDETISMVKVGKLILNKLIILLSPTRTTCTGLLRSTQISPKCWVPIPQPIYDSRASAPFIFFLLFYLPLEISISVSPLQVWHAKFCSRSLRNGNIQVNTRAPRPNKLDPMSSQQDYIHDH